MTDLKVIIASVNKKYGEETIGFASEIKYADVPRLPSGSLFLDWALGKNSKEGIAGWPLGRIVELYGPESAGKSLISMKTIAEAQKLGFDCVYFDCENTWDRTFAEKLGINADKLLISRESQGEKLLDLACELLASNKLKVMVFDSLASMIPTVEVEKSLEEQQMAPMARLMSKGLRKLTASNKNKALIIFINQLRKNPAAGCFQYNTRVVLEGGKTKRIGYLVNNKVKCNILSYNIRKNIIEFVPILNWFKNDNAEKFLHFTFQKPQGRGRGEFGCTFEHKIMIEKGKYKKAEDLKIGDTILTIINDWMPSSVQEKIIIGGLLGDGCLSKVGKGKYQYRETHCKEQDAYIKWKASFFSKKSFSRHKQGGLYFSTYLSSVFEKLYIDFYKDSRKKNSVPKNIELTPLALAIWYQDDGYLDKQSIVICTNCFNRKSIKNLQQALEKQWNINTGIRIRKRDGQMSLTFNRRNTDKFFDICKQFIHPSMEYKCPSTYRASNYFNPPKIKYEAKGLILKDCIIIAKYIKSKTRSMVRFDIETKNHNYLVDGAIVHNSYANPEYTPGGQSLKFYSSLRVEVRKGDWIEEGEKGEEGKKKKIGQFVKFRVVKNKTDIPLREGNFKFLYTGEIDKIDELISLGLLNNLIERKGPYFHFVGKTFLGREEMEKQLKEDSKLFEGAKKEVFGK